MTSTGWLVRSAPARGAALFGLAMVASLGLPPANAVTTAEVTLTCPIDGRPFKAIQVVSYFQSGMRLDFKPLGALVAPYPFPVCPENGFVMYQQNFSDGELNVLRAVVASDEYRRLRREHTDYFMAAHLKERMGATAYELAQTYLGASWEAERDRPQLVDRYRELALEKCDAFVQGKRGGSRDWWTASILAAELDRLLGRFDAVETRIGTLPLAELRTNHPDLHSLLGQIRTQAQRRNSRPEAYSGPVDDETIGRQLSRGSM